ncbi:MAG: hypothetical protein ACJA1W_002256, partial [Akkermansiaceae bacterium]
RPSRTPSLPEGYGFQGEIKLTDSTDNKSKPILESVELSFKDSSPRPAISPPRYFSPSFSKKYWFAARL